jgi:nucleoside-diphosphate-sugar epimerase
MSWTVLGAKGVIGRQLVFQLRAAGHTVYAPDRDDIELYQRPLGNVIFSIGLTADFRQRPYETVESHVSVLAEMLQKGDFESLLYLSSTRVYGRSASGSEESPLPVLSQDPSDLYNLSKLMGESLCLQDTRSSVRVARLSNVIGGEDADSSNFLPSIIRQARNGRIVMQTALDSCKDYIHIEDVVELLPLIATTGSKRVYNVASGVQITNAQWATQMVLDTSCIVEVMPDAPAVRFVAIDVTRIRTEFNFQPRPVLTTINSRFQ